MSCSASKMAWTLSSRSSGGLKSEHALSGSTPMASRAPVVSRRRLMPVREVAPVRRLGDFIVKLLIVRVSCTPHYTFYSLSRPNFGGGCAPKNFCAPTRLPQAASSAGISSGDIEKSPELLRREIRGILQSATGYLVGSSASSVASCASGM